MRSKIVSCAVLALVAAAACNKSTANKAAATGAPATSAKAPAAAGQPSGTAVPPAATPQPAAPPKPVPVQLPEVVARVNGESVTKEDFEKMIKGMEMQAGQQIPPDRRDEILRGALDQLIIYKLLSQESKARGLKIEDGEIDAKVKEVRDRFQTQDAFEKALKARGMTPDDLRKEARADLTVSKLVDAEVGTVPGPSDAEAKEFYAKNPERFKQDESVRASHILIRVDEKADAATRAKAKATIESVLKKARGGEDFGKLAQQYSQDGSAAQGGDLGYFPRGQMVPAFSDAAFALKPGQISDVVTTQFGYHIIKLTDRKPPHAVAYEEAAPQIKQFLEGQKKQQHMDTFIAEQKKKSKIEVLI